MVTTVITTMAIAYLYGVVFGSLSEANKCFKGISKDLEYLSNLSIKRRLDKIEKDLKDLKKERGKHNGEE